MTERRRTAAQYLNGVAVAVLATGGSAVLSGTLPPQFLIIAMVMSAILHAFALMISA